MGFEHRTRKTKAAIRKGRRIRQANALEHVAKVWWTIDELRQQGMGWRRIAAYLNLGEVSARRGGGWEATQVKRAHEAGSRAKTLQKPLPGVEV